MTKVAIWEATDLVSAPVWRQRLLDSGAEVAAVLNEGDDELLRQLLIELVDGDLPNCNLVVSVRPVGDALKLVEKRVGDGRGRPEGGGRAQCPVRLSHQGRSGSVSNSDRR